MMEFYRKIPGLLFIGVSIILAVLAIFFEENAAGLFISLRLLSFILFMLGLMKLFSKKK